MAKRNNKEKNSQDLVITKSDKDPNKIDFDKTDRLEFGQYLFNVQQEINKNNLRKNQDILRYLASYGATKKTALEVTKRVSKRY